MPSKADQTRAARERTLKRMEKVRLYPTPRQQARLSMMLDVCRGLYNVALQQRRDAWRTRRLGINHKTQYAQLTALRHDDLRVAAVYRECLDAVLHKLDLAFRAFFRRLKRGEVPGYPRFRAATRYNCLEFPHGDRALALNAAQTKVRVPGVGALRLRKGRNVGEFGRAMLMRRNGRWYALFECTREVHELLLTGAIVGIDRGTTVLAATSDGKLVANPRQLTRAARNISRLQRRLERHTRRTQAGHVLNGKSARRRGALRRLTRVQEHIANARRDYLHKLSRVLVDHYDVIALEHLAITNMTRSCKGTLEHPGTNVKAKSALNRHILDAGWGGLHHLICEKAESAARRVLLVRANFTSQTCFACGYVAPENRSAQRFACVACGHTDHADINAAKNILKRAQLGACGEGRSVARPLRSAKVAIAGEEPVRVAYAA